LISLGHDIAVGDTRDGSAIYRFDPILDLLFPCLVNLRVITGVAHFKKEARQDKTLSSGKLQYLLGNIFKSSWHARSIAEKEVSV
jgi:hypothetical protein